MVTILKQGTSKVKIQALLNRLFSNKKRKVVDAHSFCGVLKLEEDPLAIQKRLRSEWK